MSQAQDMCSVNSVLKTKISLTETELTQALNNVQARGPGRRKIDNEFSTAFRSYPYTEAVDYLQTRQLSRHELKASLVQWKSHWVRTIPRDWPSVPKSGTSQKMSMKSRSMKFLFGTSQKLLKHKLK